MSRVSLVSHLSHGLTEMTGQHDTLAGQMVVAKLLARHSKPHHSALDILGQLIGPQKACTSEP